MPNFRTRFIIATLAFSLIWGLYLIPNLITYLDQNASVTPFQAALYYYSLIYISIFMFIYALLPQFSIHVTRIAFIIFLLYTLIDFYEPPLIVSPDGSLSLTSPGYKASLDYSVGYYLNQSGYSWKQVYDIEAFLIPGFVISMTLLIGTPQLLGKALRRL